MGERGRGEGQAGFLIIKVHLGKNSNLMTNSLTTSILNLTHQPPPTPLSLPMGGGGREHNYYVVHTPMHVCMI